MAEKRSDLWMAFYINDYAGDTFHLNRAQHGSYLHLLMAAFKNAGWLPNDDGLLAQVAKCSPKEWKAERAIYAALFQVTDERWTHKRVTAEWEKAQKLTEQRRFAGTVSAARRQRKANERSTGVGTSVATEPPTDGQRNRRPSQSQSQIDNSEANASGARAPARDVIFTECLPWLNRRAGKDCRSLVGKWLSETRDDDAVRLVLEACEKENPVDPVSWIAARFKPRPDKGQEIRDAIARGLNS